MKELFLPALQDRANSFKTLTFFMHFLRLYNNVSERFCFLEVRIYMKDSLLCPCRYVNKMGTKWVTESFVISEKKLEKLLRFIFPQIPARFLLSITWSCVLTLTAALLKQLQKTTIAASCRPRVYLQAETASLHSHLNRLFLSLLNSWTEKLRESHILISCKQNLFLLQRKHSSREGGSCGQPIVSLVQSQGADQRLGRWKTVL